MEEPSAMVVEEVKPRRRLADLILPEAVVGACKELVEEHRRADLLRAQNLEPRNRILLLGPPGTGKSSFAEALAAELDAPLLVFRRESVFRDSIGGSAVQIPLTAPNLTPLIERLAERCVLFLRPDLFGDEWRRLLLGRGEVERIVGSLLLDIDALPSHVIVVAAMTGHSRVVRTMRCPFQLELSLEPPAPAQVQEWFRRFKERFGVKLGVASNTICKRLRGLSFAELEEFGLDVQRRYVLSRPDADIKKIVMERLQQLEVHRGLQGVDIERIVTERLLQLDKRSSTGPRRIPEIPCLDIDDIEPE